MSIAGRQLYSQGFSQQSRRPACASPRLRTLTPRPQPRRRNAAISCSTDARLTSGAVSSQRCEKEAILLQRFKAHDAAITASLVLQDAGVLSACTTQVLGVILDKFRCLLTRPFLTGGTKELVTASMDKSLALWRLQVIGFACCACCNSLSSHCFDTA